MKPIQKFQTFTYLKNDHGDSRRTEIHDDSHDPESQMLIAQLENLIENAQELIQMVQGKNNLEDWVQSKVSIADDYIETLRNYYKHR